MTTPDTIGLKKWDNVIAIAHVSIYWIVECDLERGNDRGAPPPTMEDEANPASSIDATKQTRVGTHPRSIAADFPRGDHPYDMQRTPL